MIERKSIFKGQIVDLGLETVQISPDKPPATLEIVRHPGGAAVVAIDDTDQVCLLKQYRHAVGQWLWELPAGKIDDGEPPEQTIVRELREEAGCVAAQWDKLGEMVSSPGILDERLHLYLARDLSAVGIEHELHEYIEIHWIDFNQAMNMIYSGELIDAKSIAALTRAKHVLRK